MTEQIDVPAPEMTSPTPDAPSTRLPYRLITGPDDVQFCERISAALGEGYRLYGSPAAAFDGEKVIVAQAVVLDVAVDKKGTMR